MTGVTGVVTSLPDKTVTVTGEVTRKDVSFILEEMGYEVTQDERDTGVTKADLHDKSCQSIFPVEKRRWDDSQGLVHDTTSEEIRIEVGVQNIYR